MVKHVGRPRAKISIGDKFGKLTVTGSGFKRDDRNSWWLCECECGKETNVTGYLLTSGKTKSCGCYNSDSKLKDISGEKFGRLTAIRRAGKNSHNLSLWLCKCDCGKETVVTVSNLLNGKTKSCGCLHTETFKNPRHSLSKTPLYTIWRAMKERCYNEKSISYKWYGGKGIEVCEEWKNNFKCFYDWAISNGWEKGLTIDRINPDGDYCESNCRFLTRKENASISAKEMQKRKREIKNV